jgi:hypothetical protein
LDLRVRGEERQYLPDLLDGYFSESALRRFGETAQELTIKVYTVPRYPGEEAAVQWQLGFPNCPSIKIEQHIPPSACLSIFENDFNRLFLQIGAGAAMRLFEAVRLDGALFAGGWPLSVLMRHMGIGNPAAKAQSGDIDIFIPLNAEDHENYVESHVFRALRFDGWRIRRPGQVRDRVPPLAYVTFDRFIAVHATASTQIDLILLGQDVDPRNHVAQFDLSCCQCWFDGLFPGANHWTATANGTAFVAKRNASEERIAKYRGRGFDVNVVWDY